MTTHYHPPSIDRLEEVTLKECPACKGEACFNDEEMPDYVTCLDCSMDGPLADPHGHKWNSIPRRPEVGELLKLVDEVFNNYMATPETWAKKRSQLFSYAKKLRTEYNL